MRAVRTTTAAAAVIASLATGGAATATTGAEASERGYWQHAAAASVRECGNYAPGGGAGVYNITARVTSCKTARRMARRFYRGAWNNVPRGSKPFRRGRYVCRNRTVGIELADMRCTARGGRVVRWQHGA